MLPEIDEQIGKSEEYHYKVSRKKLYILLPKNCYTFETIDKADPRVTIAGNLEPYEIDRAAILKRVYSYAVHRIKMPLPDGVEDEAYFLALEYATPLMSLYDMSMNAEAELSRERWDEQGCFWTPTQRAFVTQRASHTKERKSKRTPLDTLTFALFHAAFTDLAYVISVGYFLPVMYVAVVKRMALRLEGAIQKITPN